MTYFPWKRFIQDKSKEEQLQIELDYWKKRAEKYYGVYCQRQVDMEQFKNLREVVVNQRIELHKMNKLLKYQSKVISKLNERNNKS